MKLFLPLIILGAIAANPAFSASLTFIDKTASATQDAQENKKDKDGFRAKAQGFVDDALRKIPLINGKTYNIMSVSRSDEYRVPISTNMLLLNDYDLEKPAFPQGFIAWSQDNKDFANPTYTFTLSAGGTLEGHTLKPYRISVIIDGRELGQVTTDRDSLWHPKHYEHVSMNIDSDVQVTIQQVGEENKREARDHDDHGKVVAGDDKTEHQDHDHGKVVAGDDKTEHQVHDEQ